MEWKCTARKISQAQETLVLVGQGSEVSLAPRSLRRLRSPAAKQFPVRSVVPADRSRAGEWVTMTPRYKSIGLRTASMLFVTILVLTMAGQLLAAELIEETGARLAFQEEVKGLLSDEQFSELDDLFNQLGQAPTRWPSGELTLTDYWSAFDSFFHGHDVSARTRPLETSLALATSMRQWVASRPNSVAARVALARAEAACLAPVLLIQSEASATNSFECVPGGFERATIALEAADVAGIADPELCIAKMDVLGLQGGGLCEAQRWFNQAVHRTPQCDRAYDRMAVQQYNAGGLLALRLFTEKIATNDDARYARVIRSLTRSARASGTLQLDETFFARTGIQWDRVKNGFQELRRQAPKSLRIASEFCRLACLARDRSVAGELFAELATQRDSAVWSSKAAFLAWKHWATSEAPVPETIRVADGTPGRVATMAMTPDGLTLMAGYSGGGLFMWDLATRQLRASLHVSSDPIRTICFSPDGRQFALATCEVCSGQPHGEVGFWDVANGHRLASTGATLPPVRALAFLPTADRVMIGCDKRGPAEPVLRLWDMLKETESIPSLPLEGGVDAIAAAPTGSLVAVGSLKRCYLWDAATWQVVGNLHRQEIHQEIIRAIKFSLDGTVFATAAAPGWSERDRISGDVKIWIRDDSAAGQFRCRPLSDTSGDTLGLAFSPDAKILATAGYSGVITLWDVASGLPWLRVARDFEAIRALLFTPDGRFLISGNDAGAIHIWDCAALQHSSVDGWQTINGSKSE